ncbi:MAG TPA: hypothetical protein VHL80_14285 [Polyangia bacterium]|nr:hypothetical protein [Polyangia bacterium]
MNIAWTRSNALATLVSLVVAWGGGACGSSSPASKNGGAGSSGASGDTGATGTAGAAGGATSSTGGSTGATGCPKSALTILFNPMYSAYDGVHMFQLPAVVNGIDPSQVDIEWSASDPSMVALETDPTTGGVMITMQKAGNTNIIASAGSLCGIAPLSITAATPDDWMAGSDRYNNGVVLTRLPIGGGMRQAMDAGADGGIQAKCTDCHGDTASGPFKTVQHTPEQTGGFSDDDLVNIFQNGVVPKGGYFDTSIVSYQVWQTFHKWDVGDSAKGLVVYLRSLTPAAQTGAANFGGRFDGGVRDGGGRGGMGGGRRDAAVGQ